MSILSTSSNGLHLFSRLAIFASLTIPFYNSEATTSIDVFLKQMIPHLRAQSQVARINYHSTCPTTFLQSLPPIPITLAAESHALVAKGVSPAMFSKNKNVILSRRSGSVFVMNAGSKAEKFLAANIAILKLTEIQQYNAPELIGAALQAKQIKDAAATAGFEIVPISGGPLVAPEERFPHFPKVIRNITLDQLLDSVAKTFRGVVICGDCEAGGRKMLWIDFAGI